MWTLAELFALAQQHHQEGKLARAERLYRRILLSDPHHADAHHFLGLLAHQAGQSEAAVPLMRQAIARNPAVAVYHANLGVVLQAVGQTAEAVACFTRALQLNPDLDDAHNNLGSALGEQGRWEEALSCYREALRLNPAHGPAHYNLGNALRDQGCLEEAAASFRQALRINPRHLDALNNLGVVLKNQGQPDKAASCYEEALRLNPEYYLTRFNYSLLWLSQGNLLRGWPGYEFRWERLGIPRPHGDRPRWDGSPLNGKTILVYAEQGFGDNIQFIRYAPLVKQRGGTVLFECPPALLGVCEGMAGVDRLLPQGEALPSFDVQAALLSLPGLLGTTLATIPAEVPYLRADPRRVEHWRSELNMPSDFRIGIAWQGNPTFPDDRWRSIPLAQFEPLARIPGVRLVSLQKGVGTEQLAALAGRFEVLDLSDRLGDFTDTAAAMRNVDLVISSCTAVAHLAGALDVRIWLALPFVADWRWLREREDSPWYPTMRLFRQGRPGDWGEVFQRLAAEVLVLMNREKKQVLSPS